MIYRHCVGHKVGVQQAAGIIPLSTDLATSEATDNPHLFTYLPSTRIQAGTGACHHE